jgi:hypothetical protein
MKKTKILSAIAVTLALGTIAPSVASASMVLDTGTPTNSTTYLLNMGQWLAEEFNVSSLSEITSIAAYLTQGAGQPGDHFTLDIYSSSGFTSRSSQRPGPVYTAQGTYSADGWNTTATNWTPTTTGSFWVALQVGSTSSATGTRGLDAVAETSTTTGTVPALAFAIAGSNGQYAIQGSAVDPVGLQVSQVPLPAAGWLLVSGLAGLTGVVRRRRKVAC